MHLSDSELQQLSAITPLEMRDALRSTGGATQAANQLGISHSNLLSLSQNGPPNPKSTRFICLSDTASARAGDIAIGDLEGPEVPDLGSSDSQRLVRAVGLLAMAQRHHQQKRNDITVNTRHLHTLRTVISDILVRNPVVINPDVLIPTPLHLDTINTQKIVYTPLIYVLDLLDCGLPRRSHWDAPNIREFGVQISKIDDDQLLSFATSPHFTFARDTYPTGVCCLKAPTEPGSGFTAQTYLNFPIPTFNARPDFLGSFLEIEDVLFRHHPTQTPRSHHCMPYGDDPNDSSSNFGAAFFSACGLYLFEQAATSSAPSRNNPDSGFLGAIASRTHTSFMGPDSSFQKYLFEKLTRFAFKRNNSAITPIGIEHNVIALASGLHTAGICPTLKDAGKFILDASIGQNRPNGQLPVNDFDSASAFLHAVDTTGVFNDSTQDVIEYIKGQVSNFPSNPIPGRQTWLQAIDVFAIGKTMRETLARCRAEAEPTNTPQPAPPPSNRRRMGV